jgi:hypothetical protein
MAMAQQKDNSGILFRNRKKETDKQPDMRGSCTMGGIEYWISGWTKQGDKGKFLSLAFSPKDKETVEQKVQQCEQDDFI